MLYSTASHHWWKHAQTHRFHTFCRDKDITQLTMLPSEGRYLTVRKTDMAHASQFGIKITAGIPIKYTGGYFGNALDELNRSGVVIKTRTKL